VQTIDFAGIPQDAYIIMKLQTHVNTAVSVSVMNQIFLLSLADFSAL